MATRTPKDGEPKVPPPSAMPPRRTWLTFLLILAVNFLIVRTFFPSGDRAVTVPYTLFKDDVAKGNVARIYSRGEAITGRFEAPVTWPSSADTTARVEPRPVTTFATTLPAFADPGLEALLIANGVEISAEPIESGGGWGTLLLGFGPALLLIFFYFWIFRRAGQQGGMGGMGAGLMGIGRSR